jgi:hypothetical protein
LGVRQVERAASVPQFGSIENIGFISSFLEQLKKRITTKNWQIVEIIFFIAYFFITKKT